MSTYVAVHEGEKITDVLQEKQTKTVWAALAHGAGAALVELIGVARRFAVRRGADA